MQNSMLINQANREKISATTSILSDGFIPYVPNVGIISGSHSTLVVDTGMGKKNGEVVFNEVNSTLGDNKLMLTISHFHPEHGYGAEVFKDKAIIIYNETQEKELQDKGEEYLANFKTFGEEFADILEGTTLVLPDEIYVNKRSIDLGGVEVQLLEMGGGHTLGDQVIWLPEEKILFTGDLVENNVYPIFPYYPPQDMSVNGNRWIEILEELIDLQPKIVVPGHGKVGGVEIISTELNYLKALRADIELRLKQNQPHDQIITELTEYNEKLYPNWREPVWIDYEIKNFLDIMTNTKK